MGASPGPALGAAVIGDIFKLEERGRAMGVFFTVSNLLLTSFATIDSKWQLDLSNRNDSRSFCWRYIVFAIITCQAYISTMIVQAGLLITSHGEWCRAS